MSYHRGGHNPQPVRHSSIEKLRSNIVRLQEQQKNMEQELQHLAQQIELHLENHRDDLISLMIECGCTMPGGCAVYATLISVVAQSRNDICADVVEQAHARLLRTLEVGDFHATGLVVRFFASLASVHVVYHLSILDLFKSFLRPVYQYVEFGDEGSCAAKQLKLADPHPSHIANDDEEQLMVPAARRDIFVYIVLTALPWVGGALEHRRDELFVIMDAIEDFVYSRPRDVNAVLVCMRSGQGATAGDDAGDDAVETLWTAVASASAEGWKNKCVPECLARVLKKNSSSITAVDIPDVVVPPHRPKMVYPILRMPVNFLDKDEVESEMTDAGMDRVMAEILIQDTLIAFSDDHKLCARRLHRLPLRFPFANVVVDTVFAEMLALPNSRRPTLFYGAVITSLCEQDLGMSVPVARIAEKLFEKLPLLDTECRDRFMRWFSFHLSQFKFLWKWPEWHKECMKDAGMSPSILYEGESSSNSTIDNRSELMNPSANSRGGNHSSSSAFTPEKVKASLCGGEFTGALYRGTHRRPQFLADLIATCKRLVDRVTLQKILPQELAAIIGPAPNSNFRFQKNAAIDSSLPQIEVSQYPTATSGEQLAGLLQQKGRDEAKALAQVIKENAPVERLNEAVKKVVSQYNVPFAVAVTVQCILRLTNKTFTHIMSNFGVYHSVFQVLATAGEEATSEDGEGDGVEKVHATILSEVHSFWAASPVHVAFVIDQLLAYGAITTASVMKHAFSDSHAPLLVSAHAWGGVDAAVRQARGRMMDVARDLHITLGRREALRNNAPLPLPGLPGTPAADRLPRTMEEADQRIVNIRRTQEDTARMFDTILMTLFQCMMISVSHKISMDPEATKRLWYRVVTDRVLSIGRACAPELVSAIPKLDMVFEQNSDSHVDATIIYTQLRTIINLNVASKAPTISSE